MYTMEFIPFLEYIFFHEVNIVMLSCLAERQVTQ